MRDWQIHREREGGMKGRCRSERGWVRGTNGGRERHGGDGAGSAMD